LLEKNIKKVHEEMVRHIREVENDLFAAHKERNMEEQKFNRPWEEKRVHSHFFEEGMIFLERKEGRQT